MATPKKKATQKKKKYVSDHMFWLVVSFSLLSFVFFTLAYYNYA